MKHRYLVIIGWVGCILGLLVGFCGAMGWNIFDVDATSQTMYNGALILFTGANAFSVRTTIIHGEELRRLRQGQVDAAVRGAQTIEALSNNIKAVHKGTIEALSNNIKAVHKKTALGILVALDDDASNETKNRVKTYCRETIDDELRL